MNEVERSIETALKWRKMLDSVDHINIGPIQWYLNIGLWETLGWLNESGRYHIPKWFITGKDEP